MRAWPLMFASTLSCALSACGSGGNGAGAAAATTADDPRPGARASPARASGETVDEALVSARGQAVSDDDTAAADTLAAAEAAVAAANAGGPAHRVDPAKAAEMAGWAQARAMLRLTVRVVDRGSGRPAAGMGIGTGLGWGLTDADGRYEEQREMPLAEETITVHCPSRLRSAHGRRIGETPLVALDGRADAVIEVDATQCVEPPLRKQRVRLAGLYAWGFENSSFVPCAGMPPEAAYYDRPGGYWADVPAVIHQTLARTVPGHDGMDGRLAYVEWLGTATGPGQYGHMGLARYQLQVEALYAVSATPPATCRPRGFDEHLLFLPPPPPR